MGQIYKADFEVDNGTDYDKYNFSTTADQVSYTKNGKETNVQTELDELNTGLEIINPLKVVYVQGGIDDKITRYANELPYIFGHSEELANILGYWVFVISFALPGDKPNIAQIAIGSNGAHATRYYTHDTSWTKWQ